MKKLLVILAVLFFASAAMAADFNKSLTFEWDQASTVAYTTGNGPFTTSSSFTVTGTPGATVRRYFVLDAVSKNNKRSGYSNEVFYDFVIPIADVTTPMSLRVTVSVTP
jgi:hypothetical protein